VQRPESVVIRLPLRNALFLGKIWVKRYNLCHRRDNKSEYANRHRQASTASLIMRHNWCVGAQKRGASSEVSLSSLRSPPSFLQANQPPAHHNGVVPQQ
jgi:hypothetical protein